MKPNTFIQRHSLRIYFLIAYAVTWGGIMLFLASRGFNLAVIHPQDALLFFPMMLAGPSISGLILTIALERRSGLSTLWQKLCRWQAHWHWWAVALLTVPVLVLLILSALRAFVSPLYAPGFQAAGLLIGLLAGGFEEIGWTGFATPRLLQRFGWFKAGLLLGILWAFWHLLVDFSSNSNPMGRTWVLWFILFWILPLVSYRILMTWVYAHTQSLLIAQCMHASYSGWLFALSPTLSTREGLVWQTVFAISLWVLTILVLVTQSSVKQPHPDSV